MRGRARVVVEYRADGLWAVQTDGTLRADSVHLRKEDAVRRARELAASHEQASLVIKDPLGRVIGRDSRKDRRNIAS